ncbi:hypothetical protein VTN96DRAFT_2434 [Rasamsonia emersonii]
MPVFTSPFPTSHDTIGTSTLGSPAIPSSPPQVVRTRQNSAAENRERPATRRSSRDADVQGPSKNTSANPRPAQNDLDKRLAQYTIDWSKLPDGGKNRDPHPLDVPEDDDKDSEIGGPEDFTMNIEKYILGSGDATDRRKEDLVGKQEHQRLDSRAEEGDYSEFGPPVDMSTPSHLWRGKNTSTGKEGTHLEDIEENFADSPDQPGTPAKPVEEQHPEDDTYATVLREIEHLQDELRDRDEKIRANQERALEAESAAEEIQYLRAELQRKDALLSELHAKRDEAETLREQIQALQEQNDEKDRLLQKSSDSSEALQQQIDDLKAELRKRDERASNDDKELASLRQQLSDAREQLKKRDEALEDSTSKLREMASNTELQLRQKNTEIENLKAQLDDRVLEVCQLVENLAEVNREYDTLEERLGMLENRNRPLEEKNIVLEAEANRAKTEVVSQKNALSTLAADLSIETNGKTYHEILDSLKAWCQLKKTSDAALQEASTAQKETDELRTQITQLQAESKETASAKESLELELKRSQELVTESRALITTIESENIRLTSRLHELNANLAEAREELQRVKEERSSALETIERLRKSTAARPPSPARSKTPTTLPQESDEQKYRAIQEAHQVEIKSLQDAHASAISTLRKSYTGTAENLRALLAESEQREADLRSELRALRDSTSSHEREVAALKAEVKRLESVLAIKEEAAADADRRIARSIEKREREWERRIDLLLKERDKMSKALLWAWGEKEVGKTKEPGPGDDSRGPKQGYRYKYVVRHST